MDKIVIVAGSSGGHIIPALSLAKIIKENSPVTNIIFISKTGKIEERLLKNKDFENINLDLEKLSFSLLFPKSVLKLIKAFFESCSILRTNRPKAVVGFGGYVSVPVVLAAFFTGTPAVIHEQNVDLGKANSFLSFFASKIAVSFAETKVNLFLRRKLVLTGNPVRDDFYALKREGSLTYFGFIKEKFTLLILGGSQGALGVNSLVKTALDSLPKPLLNNLQIVHMVGKADRLAWEEYYRNIGVRSRVFDFFEEIAQAYRACDLVVARAGASSIAEIASYGIASVLIPYPFAGKHQLKNAKVLASQNAAFLIEEGADASEALVRMLKQAIETKFFLQSIREKVLNFSHRDAAEKLSKVVANLC